MALAGAATTGPGGFRFAEARVSELTGEPTVLVDPNPAPADVGRALGDAARQLGCEHVVLLDVGGDVLAHGDEAGLASPLADAVLLAAAAAIEMPTTLAVWGAGCDGELTPAEVLERVAEVWAAGGARGVLGLSDAQAERLAPVVAAVPTEASAMALRCARGATGRETIREGRRAVTLTAVGGLVFLLDPAAAVASAARLARAVAGAADIDAADATLRAMGVSTELGYERDAAR